MPKSFYQRRIAEEEAKLDKLIQQSLGADGEEYEQLTKDVAYVQHEINTLKSAEGQLTQ